MELRIHIASTWARCGTHAPGATKASAFTTCFASSRATRRTRTFVSTARTTPPDVPSHALFQLRQRSGLGRLRKQRPVHILRRVPANPTNHDLLAGLIPLED